MVIKAKIYIVEGKHVGLMVSVLVSGLSVYKWVPASLMLGS